MEHYDRAAVIPDGQFEPLTLTQLLRLTPVLLSAGRGRVERAG